MQKISSEWFLGSVEFDATEGQFTRLRPIARLAPDSSMCDILERDLEAVFPARGLVCWFGVPAGTRARQVVEFQISPIAAFDPKKKPDKFQAGHVRAAVEVVEIPAEDEDRLRDSLKAGGIFLRQAPACRTLFKLAEDRWLGPFDLVSREADYWALPNGIEMEAIPMFDAPPAPTWNTRVDGVRRTFLVTVGANLAARRMLNWQSDADVLRGVLRRLHKLDVAKFQSLNLTYAALDAYVAAVENAQLLPDQQLARERARAERVKRLRAELPLAPQLVDEIVAVLEGFRSVKQRIEARVAELGRERKAEIEALSVNEQRELEHLQRETAMARQEYDAVVRELAARSEAGSAELLAAEAAMQDRLGELREAPVRVVSELLASSAVFSALLRAPPPNRVSRRKLYPLPKGFAMPLDDVHSVIAPVSSELLREGVDPSAGFPLLAAFAAGMVPVCGGNGAVAALRAVGRSLCGGQVWWLPISPVTTCLQDILSPAGSTIAGLRELIETAHENPDELLLVVVEGINLGASDGYLLPLIELADGAACAGAHRLPLLSLDGSEAREWPGNLLLAATVSRARISLPLPRNTWEHAPLFVFDWLAVETGELLSPAPTCVPAVRWRELIAASGSASLMIAPAQSMSPNARRLAARLRAAAGVLNPEAEAEEMSRRHVVAPALASGGREIPLEFMPSAQLHFRFAHTLISDQAVDS